MGEAGHAIKSALEDICRGGAQMASGMEDAVHSAYLSADSGDIVLLSPGCSSFDMYENYAQRGDAFCRAVENLTREKRD
jgi:UDP-N-acetylmuramoylalanine--D-glutamate ligase